VELTSDVRRRNRGKRSVAGGLEKAGLIDAYDAAVVRRKEDGKVKIV
jgi:uncharacterized membrane protein